MLKALFNIFIFPGLCFLFVFGLLGEYVDRKLCARLQNRIGPPWFQPLADFIKLISKEEVIPEEADITVFKLMPANGGSSCPTRWLMGKADAARFRPRRS